MRSLKGWKLNGSCLKWLLLFVGSSSAVLGTPFSPTTIKPITSLNLFRSSPTAITEVLRTILMWARLVMRSLSLKVRWWDDNVLSLHQSLKSFLPDFILGVCWAGELYKVIPGSLISSDVSQDSFIAPHWSDNQLLSSDWLIVATQTPGVPLGGIWYLPSHPLIILTLPQSLGFITTGAWWAKFKIKLNMLVSTPSTANLQFCKSSCVTCHVSHHVWLSLTAFILPGTTWAARRVV